MLQSGFSTPFLGSTASSWHEFCIIGIVVSRGLYGGLGSSLKQHQQDKISLFVVVQRGWGLGQSGRIPEMSFKGS